MQCGYMLSHNNLINGVYGVLVRGGGVQTFDIVQHVECNASGILARGTKIVLNRY
jgi:hypothetical protein